MILQGIDLIIFDCDGVLVDSEPLSMRILLQTLAEAGVAMTESAAYDAFLGKSLASVCEILRREYRVDVDAAALMGMRERLNAAITRELKPIPGIAEVLPRLDRRVCVASSSQPERIRLSLEVTGLTGFFERALFSATMVARGKPAPDLFLYAAEQMQASPANCMVVEDSPAGVAAALSAGMAVCDFIGGSHAQEESHRRKLEALGPTAVFDDMRDLPALLARMEKARKVS